MHAFAHLPPPFPLALIASGLVFVGALVLLWLGAVTWRHAGRLARPRRVMAGWRVRAMSYIVWALALTMLGGLALVYPFDGRQIIVPPGAHVAWALQVSAYALLPDGVRAFVAGEVLLN
jgi:hypothetical protein